MTLAEHAATPDAAAYEVGDLHIDVVRQRVTRGDRELSLSGLSFELLLALVREAPRVLSYQELMDHVWPGLVVGPETVTQRIKLVREAIGDDANAPRYIGGMRGRGYRLIAPVKRVVVPSHQRRPAIIVGAAGMVLAAIAGIGIYLRTQPASTSTKTVVVAPAHTLAVLPFANVSGDPSDEYFSDGLTEELLNRLASVPGLQVTGRTSSFSFKGRKLAVADIARQLNVATLLEGSVRRGDDRVRITMQLVDAQSGYQIWSENYDRSLNDILTLQTEIAAIVARVLEVKLLGESLARLDVGGTRNARAFDAYLRARKLFDESAGEADERAALAALDDAVGLDPDYALAHAARARVLARIASGWSFEPAPRRARFSEARSAAERAVALAPDLGDAHGALAYVLAYGFLDFAAGAKAYERAVALSPGNAVVQREFALFAVCMQRGDAAVVSARRAVTLDPLNPMAHRILGRILYFLRRHEEALQAFRKALSLNPQKIEVRQNAGFAHIALGQHQTASSVCEQEPSPVSRHWCLAVAYGALGRKADAKAQLARLMSATGDSSAYYYAQIHAQWGHREQALDWLEKAWKLRHIGMAFVLVDPLLDPIRDEPRFQDTERQLRFPISAATADPRGRDTTG